MDMLQNTRKSKLKQINRTKGEKFLSLEITTKTSSQIGQLLRDAIKLCDDLADVYFLSFLEMPLPEDEYKKNNNKWAIKSTVKVMKNSNSTQHNGSWTLKNLPTL